MRKNIVVSLFLMFVLANVFALEIGEAEIKSTEGEGANIRFNNYTGQHTRIETVEQIRSIGIDLARNAKDDGSAFSYANKYSIIIVVDESEMDKYDAAIISIDRGAEVDHIRNLRLIISGFLEQRFEYSRINAQALATFITYYNVIYYKNLDFFKSKYVSKIANYVNNTNVGMSSNYADWPGNTKIVIPLTSAAKEKTLGSLGTSELSNKDIVDEMRKEEGMELEVRKDMVAIKEGEVAEQKAVVDKNKEDIKAAEDKAKQAEAALAKEKADMAKREAEIAAQKAAAKTEADKKAAAEKEAELKRLQEKAKQDEAKLKEDEKKLEEKKKEVEAQEQKIDEKKTEIADDKAGIAEDEKKLAEQKAAEDKAAEEKKAADKSEADKKAAELAAKEKALAEQQKAAEEKEKALDQRESDLRDKTLDKSIFADKLYYIKVRDYMEGGHYNNDMYIINAKTGAVDTKSAVNNICGNKYDVSKDGVVVITHTGSHNAAHNLCLLDRTNLNQVSKSKENIFWRSFVEIKEDFIYAVIKESDTAFYLGKFNTKLELVAKSSDMVDSNTFLSIYDDLIYINNANKEVMVLNKADLKLKQKLAF